MDKPTNLNDYRAAKKRSEGLDRFIEANTYPSKKDVEKDTDEGLYDFFNTSSEELLAFLNIRSE